MNAREVALGAILLALVCPSFVQADPIGFSYDFLTPNSVTGDQGNLGVVAFSTTAGGQATAGATLTAASLTAVTSANSSNPDTFSGEGYTLSLQLTDSSSGKSGTLTFNGQLFGSLTASAANITTSFSPTSKQILLGDDLYTVSVGPLVPPTVSNPTVVGTLYATVAAQSEGQIIVSVPEPSPEPTSLMLAALGVTGFAVARKMSRRT
jgi:hypothetical protein